MGKHSVGTEIRAIENDPDNSALLRNQWKLLGLISHLQMQINTLTGHSNETDFTDSQPGNLHSSDIGAFPDL